MAEKRAGLGAKLGVIVAILLGLAVATAVGAYVGFGSVYHALTSIGWRGVLFLSAYSLLPFCLLGTAWFVLVAGAPAKHWLVFVGARMVRDAGAELLPFSHVGGFVFGARAAVLGGVAGVTASATTVADVTTEIVAELGFVGLGLAILAVRLGAGVTQSALLEGGLFGLLLSTAGVVGLIMLQRRGMGLLTGFARRFLPAAATATEEFQRALTSIYDQPVRLAISVAIHFAAWVASGAGIWFALRLAGASIDLAAILAMEALVYAVRGAAFMAPMGIGVQEAAYAVIGPALGLSPEMALAVSLLRRGRDIITGVPALVVWQALESRRLVRMVAAQQYLPGAVGEP